VAVIIDKTKQNSGLASHLGRQRSGTVSWVLRDPT